MRKRSIRSVRFIAAERSAEDLARVAPEVSFSAADGALDVPALAAACARPPCMCVTRSEPAASCSASTFWVHRKNRSPSRCSRAASAR